MSETPTIAETRTTTSELSEKPAEQAAPDAEPRAEELLIEEISIDGMCGVY
jgi:mycofactocin precursor